MLNKTVRGLLLLVALAATATSAFTVPPPVVERFVIYPNPFNSQSSEAVISYRLSLDTRVVVRIDDLLGRKVRAWSFPAGTPGAQVGFNRFAWDGTDENGSRVSAGGYVCRVWAETSVGHVQMVRKIGVTR